MEAMANPVHRLLAAFLALVIVLGSLVLWIGVPIAGFWVAGHLFTKSTHIVMFSLVAIPLTMVLTGLGLYRVNGLYESIRGGEARPASRSGWLVSHTDERRSARLKRGPRQLIDVAMTVSIVTALVLMVVWFFFAAEMRLAPLP
jgi:hypothetical protein